MNSKPKRRAIKMNNDKKYQKCDLFEVLARSLLITRSYEHQAKKQRIKRIYLGIGYQIERCFLNFGFYIGG
jgi:hypothetical protein